MTGRRMEIAQSAGLPAGGSGLKRRKLLQIAAAFGAVSAFSPIKLALAQSALQRTPDQILGPFYPVGKSPEPGGDLTHLPGRSGRAEGQVLDVMGRVLNLKGDAVGGAKLEIWQANAQGRYTHPADTNPAPLDPNFDGFAVLTTDAQGRYRFKTIKPGAYPTGPTTMRPPHIHMRLSAHTDELVTQLYFDGEPLNEQDPFLQSVRPDRRNLLISKFLPPLPDGDPDSRLVVFDIVTLMG
jgi:protocatechuate 3,4-dioxygenase, beta subunit